MKYRTRSYLSFIDFLFILLLAFISMFILALLLINPITKTTEIERKAEYLVVLEWDKESADDVDVWIEDPIGNLLSFRNKTAGLLHLDKDDLGKINDIIYLPDGTSQVIELNREVATFRGWIKGEYIINVHMYTKRNVEPTNVLVRMIRVNPYKELFEERVVLTFRGEEITVRRVTLDKDGRMTNTNKAYKPFVNQTARDLGALGQERPRPPRAVP
jgi:hypothetical protein